MHDIVNKLNTAYDQARNPERRAAARSFAEGYDNRVVFERYWLPIFEEIDRRMAAT